MKGFLEIAAVSNLTGYPVEDIQHFVETRQIPFNSLPDGEIIFPIRDIEEWRKTHKVQKPPAGAPPKKSGDDWTGDEEETDKKKSGAKAPGAKKPGAKAPADAKK